MSLINSGVGCKHVCRIERDSNLDSVDDWGNQQEPSWSELSRVLCHAWMPSDSETTSQERTIVMGNFMVSLPLDTDVTERDRVGEVYVDLTGDTFFEGPMGINSIVRYSDHIELTLERAI